MIRLLSLFSLIALAGCMGQPKTKPISFVYVLTADQGEIRKSQSGQYQLVMDFKGDKKVLVYSSDNARKARLVPFKDLSVQWTSQRQSFSKDHPNSAVLINGKPQTIQLLDMKNMGSKVVFDIKADGPIQEMSGMTQLFIDYAYGCGQTWTCPPNCVECA